MYSEAHPKPPKLIPFTGLGFFLLKTLWPVSSLFSYFLGLVLQSSPCFTFFVCKSICRLARKQSYKCQRKPSATTQMIIESGEECFGLNAEGLAVGYPCPGQQRARPRAGRRCHGRVVGPVDSSFTGPPTCAPRVAVHPPQTTRRSDFRV